MVDGPARLQKGLDAMERSCCSPLPVISLSGILASASSLCGSTTGNFINHECRNLNLAGKQSILR